MEIVSTFVPNLYAFKFPNEQFDELERVIDEWNDPMFLFDFFTENEADLKGSCTIEEAIIKTKNEAKKFNKKMLDLASSNPHKLNEFFANLENKEYRSIELQRQKAKQSWLRLYALKITQGEFNNLTQQMIIFIFVELWKKNTND